MNKKKSISPVTSLLPTPTHGIFQYTTRGLKSVKISIDMYRDSDDCMLLKFSISGQSRLIKMVTPTYMRLYGSPLQLLLSIHDTLIQIYTNNGNCFGPAVSATSSLHCLEEVPFYTLSNMFQKEGLWILYGWNIMLNLQTLNRKRKILPHHRCRNLPNL